jgi:hypothetical protein
VKRRPATQSDESGPGDRAVRDLAWSSGSAWLWRRRGAPSPIAASHRPRHQDHMRLPSLAPVVQAVIPAVVHVSAAVQRPSVSSAGEEYAARLRRSKHQRADRGLRQLRSTSC